MTTKEETRVSLTCPSCGNDQNFLVKTLQMHVVHLEDSRVEVSEEGRPAVLEMITKEDPVYPAAAELIPEVAAGLLTAV